MTVLTVLVLLDSIHFLLSSETASGFYPCVVYTNLQNFVGLFEWFKSMYIVIERSIKKVSVLQSVC